LLAHDRKKSAGDVHRAHQARRQLALHLFRRQLLKVACIKAGGIIHQHIYAAESINHTGGVNNFNGTYDADVSALAALAPGAPGGNTWAVTFWSGGAEPTGTFNVLVVASPEGGWGTDPSYTALNSSGLTFNPASQRIMLTGQDADWHYMNSPGGAPDSSNPANGFNGPEGFLLDSINWAGSGTGLGLVALGQNGLGSCEGGGTLVSGGFSPFCNETDSVVIPGGVAANPVNTNLTSAGLSNWSTSAHTEFTTLGSAWTGINVDGFETPDGTCATATPDAACDYVTIVSASSVGGGIGGGGSTAAPEPSALVMLSLGLVGLFASRKRLQNLA
jgi:hypothetical protein